MSRARAGWLRLKAMSHRRRETIAGSVVAVCFVFAIFAFGATRPAEETSVADAAANPGSERSRTIDDATEARVGANAPAKVSPKDDGSAAGESSGGSGDIGVGVKPGDAVNDLLRGLGVDKPEGRQTPGQAMTPVTVGVDYQDAGDANSFFRQYGVGAGAADPGAQAQAVVAWINQHGGIGGRRLNLRMRNYDFYRERLSVLDGATCDDFGKGDKVIADIDRHASTDILIPCLAKRNIPTFVNTQSSPGTGDFSKFPGLLYSSGSPAIDRPQAAYVAALKDDGFFAKGKKVGVLRSEGLPQLDRAHEALRRALDANGIKVSLDVPVSTEDVASFLLTETNAMLKMRSADIARIVVVDENGVVAGQFMRNAESQRYRPLYGINSIASPQFLTRETPVRQLYGAVGVGWSPLVDVPAGGDVVGPVRALCDKIFRAFEIDTGERTPFGQYTAYHVCDSLLLIAAAVAKSGDPSPLGLRKGIDAVGPKWRSPLALSSRLGGDRGDGADQWRLLRFKGACACFHYEGPGHAF